MKKILSILGTICLTATGASSVIACKKTEEDKQIEWEETDVNKDLKKLNIINEKIKKEFEKSLFKENILLTDDNLSKAYKWVNSNNPSLILLFNNIEHQNFKKYFLKYFYSIFNDVNKQIKDEYSNYYKNNDVIFLLESDIEIKLNFVDIEKLSTLSNVNVNIIDKLQIVQINFDFKYKVKFKKYESNNFYGVSFNVTNDLEKFNLIYNGSLTYFNKNFIDFFQNKSQIDITTGDFKSLYDNFDIDYKKSLISIDNIYKKVLNQFIINNQNLKKIITYNKNINILKTQTTLFNNIYEKGFYYNNQKNNIAKNSFLKKLFNNNIGEIKPDHFVDLYMTKIVSKFNINPDIELGQFKINLNYINICGMTFNGFFNKNNTDYISTIILTKNKLKEKLTNFINNIIAFLKYYNVEYKDKYYFNVPTNVWNELTDKITNYSLPEILFEKFINDQNIINQNLPDLKLFRFKQIFNWKKCRMKFDIEKNMFLYDGCGFDAGFTFGLSEIYYMPFYYLWFKYKYVVVKAKA